MSVEYTRIIDIVAGDPYSLRRRFKKVPEGSAVTKAWFTVKPLEALEDLDDIGAKFQKIITTTTGSHGQIEDDGAVSGTAIVRFDLSAADTTTLRTDEYWDYFDVQILVNGQVVTPLIGDIRAQLGTTRATA